MRFSRLSILVLLCALAFAQGLAFASTNDSFQKGLEHYRSGLFAEAAKEFRASAENTPSSGAFVNLGLSEWRRGRAGRAILAWEQAQWVVPFDARARVNLEYARQLTGITSPEYSWYERVSNWLPVNAWSWIAGGSLWLAIGLVVLPGVLRRPKSTWQQAIAALSLAIFLASLPAHLGVATRARIGFVLQKDAPLRLTPTTEAEQVAKLPAGEPARELYRRAEYVFVHTARGQGWVEESQFERICPR